MKKFITAALCMALLAGCRSNHTPVLSDVQISVKDSLWQVEPAYDAEGNSIHAFVSLGRNERCVMSATLEGRPAEGEMIGYTFRKDDAHRFLFGKQTLGGESYMVIYRVFQGVEILQEKTLLTKDQSRMPVYLRMTAKNGRVRFYYAFEPFDRWETDGWIRLGIMEGWTVMSKKDGVKGYQIGLYDGPALVRELGPHKAEPMQSMDTALVCTIPPTYRNDRYYSCQGLGIQGNHAVIIRDKGWCEIYDLQTGQTESFYKLRDNDSHCNNAVFGPDRLTEDSLFPLMYISEDNGTHACFVTELGWDDSRIVQRIYYDSDKEAYPGPIDWIVDRENRMLYTYGGVRWGMRHLKGFRLPPVDQPEVHLTPEDVLFEMTYNEVGIGQGGFIKDGKVYFSAGYPPFHCKLHVFDMEAKEEILCQELLPLQYEPEGIEIVGDKLYTVFWCSEGITKIYEFALPTP